MGKFYRVLCEVMAIQTTIENFMDEKLKLFEISITHWIFFGISDIHSHENPLVF